MNDIAATFKPMSYKYSVVIPAAGTGSRMKSYGAKSLIDLPSGKKLIDLQIERIHAVLSTPQIVVVTGHEHNKVAAYLNKNHKHVEVVFNPDFKTTNVVRSIGLGLEQVKYKRVITMNGDLVFNTETLSVPIGNESSLFIDPNSTMHGDEVGCTVDAHYVEYLMYDLPQKWAQIAYLCGEELSTFKMLCSLPNYHTRFTFEALNQIILLGGKFKAMSHKDSKIIDIDTSKDLDRIGSIL